MSKTGDLGDFFSLVAEEEKNKKIELEAKLEKAKAEQEIIETLGKLLSTLTENKPNIENEQVTEQVVEVPEQITEQVVEVIKEVNLGLIGGNTTTKTEDPLTPLAQNFVTFDDLNKHYKTYIARVQQQLSSLGGGGEVNFRYLDDVNRATMTPSNNNWVLEYDSATKKSQFTNKIGPIEHVNFDVNHVETGDEQVGTLNWNNADRTLNIHHDNGVKQQVGQEQYYLIKNATGVIIPNGTVCMFGGAETFDGARLLAVPMIADGTYPSLYVMGVATQNIGIGELGFVTSFGRVGDIDTSAWNLGDILYANPTIPGGLINIKPTAPYNVVPVGAVLRVDPLVGDIFVRPTVEQQMLYGRFSDTTDQIPLLADTPYPIKFNIENEANGFRTNGGELPTSTITCEQSGYYHLSSALSLTSTNASAKSFYVWLRKNGVDVPLSSKRQSVTGNGIYQVLNYNFTLSLLKDDIIELMYAASDVTIGITAPPATAFSPTIPSATLLITQVAL